MGDSNTKLIFAMIITLLVVSGVIITIIIHEYVEHKGPFGSPYVAPAVDNCFRPAGQVFTLSPEQRAIRASYISSIIPTLP